MSGKEETMNQVEEKAEKNAEVTRPKRVNRRVGVLRDLFSFLWQNKLWWMIPIMVVLIAFSVLIWFAQSATIPFVYTLF